MSAQTVKPWQDMTDPERNAAIARLVGWQPAPGCCGVCGWALSAGGTGCTPDSCSERPLPARRADEPPAYVSDPRAAQQVEAHMSRVSLRGRYADALVDVCAALDTRLVRDAGGVWALLLASPAQRCEAAYRVLSEGGAE